MAWYDRFRRARSEQPKTPPTINKIVGADKEFDLLNINSFDNSNITYRNGLTLDDIDTILRDKQGHIIDLFKLSDYYTDADEICAAINKQVYMPYASGSKWYLTCKNKKTIDIFEQYYKLIHLKEKIDDIFMNYFKYNNVYVYIWDGNIMVLPPHKCRIGNVSLNGQPTVFFDVQSIRNELKQKSWSYKESKEIKDDDINTIYEGYPPEVLDAVKANAQYAQLNTANCYVIQGPKEGWMRYAVPWIAAALYPLMRKLLISKWENSMLQLSMRSFVHVKYGDTKNDILPDRGQLQAVRGVFSAAMSGAPLAVTNQLAEAKTVVTDISQLYQWPLYANVNASIMTAGGISGILATGTSEDGSTFASAQVSIQTATARIEAARKLIEAFMDKVNERLIEDIHLVKKNNTKDAPTFHFAPFDFNGDKTLRLSCQYLWLNGLLSTLSMMDAHGYSLTKERDARQNEATDGTDETMLPRAATVLAVTNTEPSNTDNDVGRPKLDDSERVSDPASSLTSKEAKEAKLLSAL